MYHYIVAFVGIVSNIHALCLQYKWLTWICKLPSVVVGILQGILPPVLLAVLMMLLPIVLRYVCPPLHKRSMLTHVMVDYLRASKVFQKGPGWNLA
jgi:hypothetical protein